ncbi:flagellar hook-basal body complex protein FliE [Sphingobium sp. TCM1]|uniref:flagellar hook-basal body complex protein FliE n=1 Tax=Sphingobium sp. TCM1 TaxID=453246 RepID=UPI0007F43D55|nr:flagellar hook-basal body complex protein FliE [Sphingobium sp. TCM1]OAN52572.1 flagellar hook-basal body protein FliE [Sphingobium sp. TCM1]
MAIGTLDAAAAYGRSLKTLAPLAGEGTTGIGQKEAGGGSFGSMIETMVSDAAGTLRVAETESAKQVAGKGDMIDVVTAIGAAETALDTVVAVRDRVVSAYSEIMRMQI